MHRKIGLAVLAAMLVSTGLVSMASAEVGLKANANANIGVRTDEASGSVNAEIEAKATTSVGKDDDRDNATSEEKENEDNGRNASSSARANGQSTAEAHRSAVAAFVQGLLSIANREGGIGAQVRAIASAQQDSEGTTASDIAKVESKGKVSTFFFGSDYKSLGELRSEIVKTQNNIDRLTELLSQTTSVDDKAQLTTQINALKDSQVKLDAFVTAHENTFSLFGWVARMFAK